MRRFLREVPVGVLSLSAENPPSATLISNLERHAAVGTQASRGVKLAVQRRSHLANFTVGYQTPAFANATLRTVASNWRVSGILNARSRPWMTILSGRDNAFNGMANQRADRIADDVYGAKTLNNFLNPVAFAQPAAGKFGNRPRNSIKGPSFHKVDLALSRLVSLAATRTSSCA